MGLCSLTDWLQWAPKNKAFVFHISYRSENFVTESLQWLRRELKEQSADIYIYFLFFPFIWISTTPDFPSGKNLEAKQELVTKVKNF